MNTTIALPTGLVAATLLAVPAGEELAFAPDEGMTVTRTFHETCALELASAVRTINGEELGQDDVEVEVRNERELVFADEYLDVGDERIEKLARTYETMSCTTFVSSVEGDRNDQEAEVDGESELEGATVVFTWDAEAEEYEAAFAKEDDGRDDDLLDELHGRADLGVLLSPGEMSEGDSWTVDPATLAALLRFGGDVSLIPDMDPEDNAEGPVILCFFMCLEEGGADAEGEIELTWDGTEETEDGEFASISLAVDLTTVRDGLEALVELAEVLDAEESGMTDMDVLEFTSVFDGEGTLLWDTKRNVAHRLVLEGDIEVTLAAESAMDGMEMVMEMIFAGTSEVTLDVE